MNAPTCGTHTRCPSELATPTAHTRCSKRGPRTRLRARIPRVSPMTEARTTCAAARNLASSSLRLVCGDGTIAIPARDNGVCCGDDERVFGLPSRPIAAAAARVPGSGETLPPRSGDSPRTFSRSFRSDPARVTLRLPPGEGSPSDDMATLRRCCGEGVLRVVAPSAKDAAVPPLLDLRRRPVGGDPRDRAGDGCASRPGDTDARSGERAAIVAANGQRPRATLPLPRVATLLCVPAGATVARQRSTFAQSINRALASPAQPTSLTRVSLQWSHHHRQRHRLGDSRGAARYRRALRLLLVPAWTQHHVRGVWLCPCSDPCAACTVPCDTCHSCAPR